MSEVLAFIVTLGVRLLYRSMLKTFIQTDRKQNALIIGAGSGGYIMLNEIYHNKKYPFNVVFVKFAFFAQ